MTHEPTVQVESDDNQPILDQLATLRTAIASGQVRALVVGVVTDNGQYVLINFDQCGTADLGRALITLETLKGHVLERVGVWDAGQDGPGCECCREGSDDEVLN